MDPVSALGLAANIFQFVETAFKLVREAKSIYHSIDGTAESVARLELNANSIKSACAAPIKSNEPQEVQNLRAEISQTADRLLARASKLRLPGGLSRSKRDALFKAIKRRLSEKEIESMMKDLDQLTNRISQFTLNNLQMQQDNLTAGMSQVIDKLRARAIVDTKGIQALHGTIANGFAQLSVQTRAPHCDFQQMEILIKAVIEMNNENMAIRKQQAVLNSLWLDVIPARYEQIPEAYKNTFEWVYQDKYPQTNQHQRPLIRGTNTFRSWLTSQDRIYWISGNAGSGKSTLMKFIADNSKTADLLRSWSSESQLIFARFYFWKPGSTEQNSIKGLLRSLLYEIFKQCPGLISVALSDVQYQSGKPRLGFREEDVGSDPSMTGYRWTLHTMSDTLDKIVNQKSIECRMCFFIDGLDEYAGDRDKLVPFLTALISSPTVKLCVSSRPENFFISLFEKRLRVGANSILHLHELTRNDIQTMVRGRLCEYTEFEENYTSYRRDGLIDIVVAKADGVFLWADVVVVSILNGLVAGDTLDLLRQRIDRLPDSADLNALFQRMIDDINDDYLEQARTLFSICIAVSEHGPFLDEESCVDSATNCVPLLSLPFLCNDDDPTKLRDFDMCSPEQILPLLDRVQRRLNARCAGLIKVFDVPLPVSRIVCEYKTRQSPVVAFNEDGVHDRRYEGLYEFKDYACWATAADGCAVSHEDHLCPRASSLSLVYCRKAGMIHRAVVEFLQQYGHISTTGSNSVKVDQIAKSIHLLSLGHIRCLQCMPVDRNTSPIVLRLVGILMTYLRHERLSESAVVLELCKMIERTMGKNRRCKPLSHCEQDTYVDEIVLQLYESPNAWSWSVLRLLYTSLAAFFVTFGPRAWLRSKVEQKDAAYLPESGLLKYVVLHQICHYALPDIRWSCPRPGFLIIVEYIEAFGLNSLKGVTIHPGLLAFRHQNVVLWPDGTRKSKRSRTPDRQCPLPAAGFQDFLSFYNVAATDYPLNGFSGRLQFECSYFRNQSLNRDAIRIPMEQTLMFLLLHRLDLQPLLISCLKRAMGQISNVDEYFVGMTVISWVQSFAHRSGPRPPPFLDFLALLLNAGANPNCICKATNPADDNDDGDGCDGYELHNLYTKQAPTVWAVVLASLYSTLQEPILFSWADIWDWPNLVMQFLQAGADPNVKFNFVVFEPIVPGKQFAVNGIRDALTKIVGNPHVLATIKAQSRSLLLRVEEFLETGVDPLTLDSDEEAWYSASEEPKETDVT